MNHYFKIHYYNLQHTEATTHNTYLETKLFNLTHRC